MEILKNQRSRAKIQRSPRERERGEKKHAKSNCRAKRDYDFESSGKPDAGLVPIKDPDRFQER